jgi:hypothetical protein
MKSYSSALLLIFKNAGSNFRHRALQTMLQSLNANKMSSQFDISVLDGTLLYVLN